MEHVREFVLRGNVVELAVAVVIGAVVTGSVTSFAAPLVGFATGGGEREPASTTTRARSV